MGKAFFFHFHSFLFPVGKGKRKEHFFTFLMGEDKRNVFALPPLLLPSLAIKSNPFFPFPIFSTLKFLFQALRGQPVEPVQVSVIGPPFSGSEHLDACASLTPPWMAALVSPPPPSTAEASEAVTRSQVHPLDANCLSCEQHARLGSERCSSALAASIVAQSALAYFAA